MSTAIYQQAIKDLATAAHGAAGIGFALSVSLDNPLCGDRVDLSMERRDGAIASVEVRTRGCLLCRAAASLVGLRARHLRGGTAAALLAAVDDFLARDGTVPPGWPELAAFVPVRAHRSRHGCVLLPFRALAQAESESA